MPDAGASQGNNGYDLTYAVSQPNPIIQPDGSAAGTTIQSTKMTFQEALVYERIFSNQLGLSLGNPLEILADSKAFQEVRIAYRNSEEQAQRYMGPPTPLSRQEIEFGVYWAKGPFGAYYKYKNGFMMLESHQKFLVLQSWFAEKVEEVDKYLEKMNVDDTQNNALPGQVKVAELSSRHNTGYLKESPAQNMVASVEKDNVSKESGKAQDYMLGYKPYTLFALAGESPLYKSVLDATSGIWDGFTNKSKELASGIYELAKLQNPVEQAKIVYEFYKFYKSGEFAKLMNELEAQGITGVTATVGGTVYNATIGDWIKRYHEMKYAESIGDDYNTYRLATELGIDIGLTLTIVGGAAKLSINLPQAFRGLSTKQAATEVKIVRHAVGSTRQAESVLKGIDPKFFNPNSRFGGGFYVTVEGETAVAELAAHDVKATQVIRYNFNLSNQKVLDLTNPNIASEWGFTTSLSTEACQAIAAKARAQGYNAISFPSYRGSGMNYVIYDNFDKILKPQMISPVD